MLRICPERDAICPHGMDCPYSRDRYTCRKGWSNDPEPPRPKSSLRRVKARIPTHPEKE